MDASTGPGTGTEAETGAETRAETGAETGTGGQGQPALSSRPSRRGTRQRAAVAAVLDEAEGFLSAQQLHARLRERGHSVGLATVYRTLQQLCEDGEIDVLRTGNGEAVYRRCSPRHHHHLICRDCRRSVEIDNAAVERWAQQIAAENGFADVEHVVEVYGTCSRCAAQE